MHTNSCGDATTGPCKCAGCAGSMHGWPGYLSAALPDHAFARQRLRREAGTAWSEATASRTRKSPTLRKARAALRGACASIADWLAAQAVSPPVTAAKASGALCDEIAQLLAKPVMKAVDQVADGPGRPDVRLALADHFFCGLLAEFAHNIDQLGSALDTGVETLVSAIIDSRTAGDRSPVEEVIVRAAVSAFTAGIREIVSRLSLVGRIREIQQAARIIAVLMCPAPEKHGEVARYCVDPLQTPIITDMIRRQLATALPQWITPEV